jgi:hypothetical protein
MGVGSRQHMFQNGPLALCTVPKTYVMTMGDNISNNEKHFQKCFSNLALHLYSRNIHIMSKFFPF